MRPHRTIAFLTLLLGAPAGAAPRPPVDEVVSRMQAFYEKTRDLKAKFKQVYVDTLYQRRRVRYGYLYVKKPGKMRWNYVKPERTSFIADGKTLWVWEPEERQAFRNPLSADTLSTGLTFLLGKGDLREAFAVAYVRDDDKEDRLGGPDALVLKLVPKKPTAQYRYLVLAVRPSDHAVTESMVVGKSTRNHFIFTRIRVNTGLGDARFRFTPPAGARVIDATRLGR